MTKQSLPRLLRPRNDLFPGGDATKEFANLSRRDRIASTAEQPGPKAAYDSMKAERASPPCGGLTFSVGKVHVFSFIVLVSTFGYKWGLRSAVLSYNFFNAMFIAVIMKMLWKFGRCGAGSDSHGRAGFFLQEWRGHGGNKLDEEDKWTSERLPAATIYIPVYTEPFDEVLRPTLDKALHAVRYYNQESLRRSINEEDREVMANIIVLDDGLLVVDAEEYQRRKAFYHKHGIAYVARPRPGHLKYRREGFFKKSGNLNFVHQLDQLARRCPVQPPSSWSRMHAQFLEGNSLCGPASEEEISAASQCCSPAAPWCSCQHLFEAPHTSDDSESVALSFAQALSIAELHGDCRLGDFLLLLDNDSCLPVSSLLDSVELMRRDSSLGFVQHCSEPLNMDENWVSQVTGFGTYLFWWVVLPLRAWTAPCPLLGHNVMLRKEAIEAAGFFHTGRGSDDVSTNLAMRAATDGWKFHGLLVQLYAPGQAFKEGVEGSYLRLAAQMRRYGAISHGMVFNPIADWLSQGVLETDFSNFIRAPGVPCEEIFEALQFFLSGLQGTFVVFVQTGRILFLILDARATGMYDALEIEGIGVVTSFVITMLAPVVLVLLTYLHVGSSFLPFMSAVRFVAFCPLLYGGLTFMFTFGFLWDHMLKRASGYASTRKGTGIPTFHELLVLNRPQLIAGVAVLSIVLVLATDTECPTRVRAMICLPQLVFALSLLVSPFVFDVFSWRQPTSPQCKDFLEVGCFRDQVLDAGAPILGIP